MTSKPKSTGRTTVTLICDACEYLGHSFSDYFEVATRAENEALKKAGRDPLIAEKHLAEKADAFGKGFKRLKELGESFDAGFKIEPHLILFAKRVADGWRPGQADAVRRLSRQHSGRITTHMATSRMTH